MCTKIQDFACKIRKFFWGSYPRTPSAGEGDRSSRTHPQHGCTMRGGALCPPPPGPRTQTPTHTSTPPKFKILYNTLVCKHLISLDCHEGDIHSRIFKFIGQINVQFHTSW
jgi:hypothetical protein